MALYIYKCHTFEFDLSGDPYGAKRTVPPLHRDQNLLTFWGHFRYVTAARAVGDFTYRQEERRGLNKGGKLPK